MITGGFGFTLDIRSGRFRGWYIDPAGVKRWANNDEIVQPDAAEGESDD